MSCVELVGPRPWDNVKVTFKLPVFAAKKLKELALRGDGRLKEIGILKVKVSSLLDCKSVHF